MLCPSVPSAPVGGPVGVIHVLKILRTELEIAMALTGRASLDSIDRSGERIRSSDLHEIARLWRDYRKSLQ